MNPNYTWMWNKEYFWVQVIESLIDLQFRLRLERQRFISSRTNNTNAVQTSHKSAPARRPRAWWVGIMSVCGGEGCTGIKLSETTSEEEEGERQTMSADVRRCDGLRSAGRSAGGSKFNCWRLGGLEYEPGGPHPNQLPPPLPGGFSPYRSRAKTPPWPSGPGVCDGPKHHSIKTL